jgi:hypothetical protein
MCVDSKFGNCVEKFGYVQTCLDIFIQICVQRICENSFRYILDRFG